MSKLLEPEMVMMLQRRLNEYDFGWERKLRPDGVWGPKTEERAICAAIADRADSQVRLDILNALTRAITLVGKGGDGRNNQGEWLEHIRHVSNAGSPGGAWCAVLMSYLFEGVEPTAGAKAFGNHAMGELPDTYRIRPEAMKIGEAAICVWDRGAKKWMGHVGLCMRLRDCFAVIAGNEGKEDRVKAYVLNPEKFSHKLEQLIVQRKS